MLGQPLAGGAEGTAHPARGKEAGTPKSLEALQALLGGAAEGQPGEVFSFPARFWAGL